VAGCRNGVTGIMGSIVDHRGVGKGYADEQPQPQQGGKAGLQNLGGSRLYGGCVIGNSCLRHASFS
jgi:hypothetical protein